MSRPGVVVIDVYRPGGGGGDELWGGLGPGELNSRAMMTFIYREVLLYGGQVRRAL